MKWLPRTGSKKGVVANKNSRNNFLSSSWLILLTTCLILTGAFLSVGGWKLSSRIFASDSTQKSSAEIDEIAAKISVKISSEDFLGSGFIILEEQGKYTVITNQHVLRAGKAPYSIQTADGTIHAAKVIPSSPSKDSYDLALLEFQTRKIYTAAQIGNSLHLQVGEPVYAVGFPYTEPQPKEQAADFKQPVAEEIKGLELKVGRVAIILNQALEEGYQIAYTNDVRKGMSGGPLLNHQGEVVGVNGKHAYPLWESAEFYQDGSQPCPALQNLITRSSLAIPIEKTLSLASKLKSLRLSGDIQASKELKWSAKDSKLVAEMQAEAEATNNCRKQ